MMSDYDRDIDIESDAERRAHHNALERKRRDQLKDSFVDLQEKLPSLQSENSASRVQILKKTAEYIQLKNQSNSSSQQQINDLDRQNKLLKLEIRKHERELRKLSKTQPVDIGTSDLSESSGSE